MTASRQIIGVNLGGWLILEKWLTPSLFTETGVHDEYSFMRTPGAKQRINHHRRTFIGEADFAWLAAHSVRFVRIPVGYWLFEAEDGYEPTIEYMDKAMKWAVKHGINVIIDLHGAKGSQNGFDNSGRAGNVGWFNDVYQAETIAVLCKIALRYKDSSALWGIELLNEPQSKGHFWSLLKFYRRAYKHLRQILRPGTHIIYHDGFRPLLFAGALWPRKSHPVMMDVHWYAFPINDTNLDSYLDKSSRRRQLLLAFLQLWQPVIVGEWSTVLPQRFFDSTHLENHMDILAKNARMQQQSYRHSAGWMYWNYTADGDGMWNFRDLVERDIIKLPRDHN